MDLENIEIVDLLNNTDYSFDQKLNFLIEMGKEIKFSTSFGLEDQVVHGLLAQGQYESVEIFTLDTGRLYAETYTTWSTTLDRFPNIKVKAFYPDTQSIEEYVTSNGINAFYQSLDLRKSCCHIRKVEPLRRALAGVDVWITGLRAAQSVNRLDMVMAEWDHTHQLIKFNPVLFWSLDEVKNYLIEYQIPYNALHDKGFPSIGCAPCTRAIKEGEDLRAGRWWWEHNTTKECGLHASYGSAK